MALEQRQKAILGAGALACIGAIPVGLAGGLLIKYGRHYAPTSVILVGLALLAVLGLVVSLPYWRRLDHMARDAHQISWWWGGLFGALFGLMALVALNPTDPLNPMFFGAVLVVVIQLSATILFWLGWWARRLPRG